MSAFDDYFYLGHIAKIHGYNGKIVAFLDVDKPEEYVGLEMIFVNLDEKPVPFFIEESSLKNSKLTIKLQDVNNEEEASELVKKELYLPLSMLPKLSGNKFYYHEVIGFAVIDEQFGEIGTVSQVLEYPAQAVLQVFHNEKEVLVPVHDTVIRKIDREKKQIVVKMPEGLLDLYMAS